jgi:hypothetical protein
MARVRLVVMSCVLVVLSVASCGGSSTGRGTPSSSTASTTPPSSTNLTPTSTTAPPDLTVELSASPELVAVGTPVSFTVIARTTGILSIEDFRFGDGESSGANAGMISCGQTGQPVTTNPYSHPYATPGTYVVTVRVGAIGPAPACANLDVTRTATVTVAAPLSTATVGGMFSSPTQNIVCQIRTTGTEQVRCASFTPPHLVEMAANGTYISCSGSQCPLGNPGPGIPVLPYGSATGDGPFLCLSTSSGVTCTITLGKGFTISRAGIRAVASSGT